GTGMEAKTLPQALWGGDWGRSIRLRGFPELNPSIYT
ncbi:hypothetical protein L195_g063354, partial [Trifolium pratense]